MSRSHRHNPFSGITTAETEKDDKRIANRRLRSRHRDEMRAIESLQDYEDAEDLSTIREVSSVWCFRKDGKTYWPEPSLEPDQFDIRIAELRGVPVEEVMKERHNRWEQFMRK